MGDNDQKPESEITEEFNVTHGALEVQAEFKTPKLAIGEVFILENNRIEPSAEEKEKHFGLKKEEFENLPSVVVDQVTEDFVAKQTERYQDAFDRTVVTYENYLSDEKQYGAVEMRDIAVGMMETELMLLQDNSMVQGAISRIEDGATAEVAIDDSYQEKVDMFQGMQDAYFQKTAVELEQHRATMQHHLHPEKSLATMAQIKPGAVVAMSTISLSSLSYFQDRETQEPIVRGVISDAGGLQSHAAILLNGLGISYARVERDDMDRMKNGDQAILDGAAEKILLHPNNDLIHKYEGDLAQQEEAHVGLQNKWAKKKSTSTVDGEKFNVHANYGSSWDTYSTKRANPVGIGLYRSEVTLLMRHGDVELKEGQELLKSVDNLPKEEDWNRVFRQNLSSCSDKEGGFIGTTIRTPDFAGDKFEFLDPGVRQEQEDKATLTQMRALAQLQHDLAGEGHKNKIKVMVPMIGSAEQMHARQTMMDEQARDLGVKTIKLGTMIEVPSVLTELENLDASFWSVGSNDMIDNILGQSRYVAQGDKNRDNTNAAVLKAFERITTMAQKCSVPVSLCGDIGADPQYTAMLVGAGFRNVSAASDRIPEVKEIASRVDVSEAQQLFNQLLVTEKREDRESLLKNFNEDRLGLSADGRIDMAWKKPEDALDLGSEPA